MKAYILDASLHSYPAGIVEFSHTPHWEEVLDALIIRGNISGSRRDAYDCFYVCQGKNGSLEVVFRSEQSLAFRLIPQQ